MKLNFLDVRNCHALLPPPNGLPLIRRLDECLHGINSKDGELLRSIDALIKQNKNTINRSYGSQRLCNSPIEIAQNSDVPNKAVRTQGINRTWPGPAKLHTLQFYENQLVWKTIVPLQFLLKGWGDARDGYQCYIQQSHII